MFCATKTTKPPSHIVGWRFVMLLVGLGGKNRKQKRYFIDSCKMFVFEISAMTGASDAISFA